MNLTGRLGVLYISAKTEWDAIEMKNYARGIRKFQRELKISVSNFQQLGLICELTNDLVLARRVITLVEEGDFSD